MKLSDADYGALEELRETAEYKDAQTAALSGLRDPLNDSDYDSFDEFMFAAGMRHLMKKMRALLDEDEYGNDW